MTAMPKPTALTAGYDAIYDAWNRLTEIKETGGAIVADYQYDGLNRRTTKLVSSTTTHFYYSDQWQVLEERLNALTTANQQYVWGIRYIDDLVLRDHTTLGRHYALQDANWNAVAITDTTGTVKQRFEYDAYGKPLALNPNFTTPYNGTNYQWEYLFTGRLIDLETNLYQYRNRYYHAELGVFISRDRETYLDGMNLYQYVKCNPLRYLDPTGLAKYTVISGIGTEGIGFGLLDEAEVWLHLTCEDGKTTRAITAESVFGILLEIKFFPGNITDIKWKCKDGSTVNCKTVNVKVTIGTSLKIGQIATGNIVLTACCCSCPNGGHSPGAIPPKGKEINEWIDEAGASIGSIFGMGVDGERGGEGAIEIIE